MKEENEHLILAYLQGKLSPEERVRFESWMNESAENKAVTDDFRRIWQMTNSASVAAPVSSEEDWQRLSRSLETATHQKAKTPLRRYYGIAAAILLLAVTSAVIYLAYFTTGSNVIETASDTRHVTLPDGSEVWMNAESRLAFLDNFTEDRFVILEGEAFFDVMPNPDKPFRIRAGDGEVKVLGTSFNVKAYREENQTEVYVVTGKVDFHTLNSSTGQLLTPGLTGVLDKKTQRVASIKGDENDVAWKDKKLVFRKTPLSVVVKTLRTYYKTDIIVANQTLMACRFTGTFKDAPLSEVIETLTTALDLKVDHQENTYTLDGTGCNE